MIIGKRIRLRAISRDDLPDFTTWLNDPDVRRNVHIYYPLSLDQEEAWFREIQQHAVEEQPLAIEVKEKNQWTLIGDSGFINLEQHDRSAEIGIFIGNKNFWNKGLGTEVMQLMVRYGFLNLNLNRIYLRVVETNLAGIRCYEKAGFKHEGRMRQAHFLEGTYVDILMMSILKNEWNQENMKEGSA
jgi:diamine N-acetyltransferase